MIHCRQQSIGDYHKSENAHTHRRTLLCTNETKPVIAVSLAVIFQAPDAHFPPEPYQTGTFKQAALAHAPMLTDL